jgi:hypothetical protein
MSSDGYCELVTVNKDATGTCLRAAIAERLRRMVFIDADKITIKSVRGLVFDGDLVRENWKYTFHVRTTQDDFQEFCYGADARRHFSDKVSRLETCAIADKIYWRTIYDEAVAELASLVDWPKRYRVLLRNSRFRLQNLIEKTRVHVDAQQRKADPVFVEIVYCLENVDTIRRRVTSLEDFLQSIPQLAKAIHFQALFLASYLSRWPFELDPLVSDSKNRLHALMVKTMDSARPI